MFIKMCVRIFCDYCCCCSVVVSVNPIDISSQMKIIHFNNYVPLISVNMSEKLYFFFQRTLQSVQHAHSQEKHGTQQETGKHVKNAHKNNMQCFWLVLLLCFL